MSPAEVVARIRRTVCHCYDAAVWYHPPTWRRRWAPPGAEAARLGGEARGFLRRTRAERLAAHDPDRAARIVDAAERVLAGRVRFFGYPEVELPASVDYAYDPHARARWPPRHAKLLDYRHAGLDPKWIWELNRCQQLPLLVEAWLLTGERRYADRAVAVLEQWAEQNPVGRGIAWSNGYEAGLRAISLATAVDGLRGILPAASAAAAVRVLWQHVRWIERDPSTHSSANNHRIGELVGLLVVSSLVPEVPGSPARGATALAELLDQLDLQLLSDGTGAEQAHYYHLHVVELALLAVATLDAVGQEVPSRLVAALERAASALAAQVGPAERPPRYGDEDDSVAIRLEPDDRREVAALAAALAARLGHPGARRLAPRLGATAFWLFGEAGRRRFEETTPAAPPESVVLEDAGVGILRQGRLRVTLDFGPLGYLAPAAHGHADALSITVAEDGDELVTDPGTGSYFRRPDLRDAFRGTGFHATVLVDGKEQSQPGGAFLWTRHAKAWLRDADLDRNALVAEHDGYRVLDDPVRHRRAVVVLDERVVLVYDRLDARREHAYSVRWPLHPRLEASLRDETCVATLNGHTRLVLVTASSAAGSLAALRGQEQPPAGWWSARLEAIQPAWLVHFDARAVGRFEVATVLSCEALAAAPSLVSAPEATLVELRTQRGALRVRLALDSPHPVVLEPLLTDGAPDTELVPRGGRLEPELVDVRPQPELE